VLFLSQIVPYPPHGGVLQRGYHLLRELGRHASVHVLAFVHPDVLPTEAERVESRRALGAFCESVEYFPLWAKRSGMHKIAALAISSSSPRPFSVIAHRSRPFARRVADYLHQVPVDLVHVDTLALSQFADVPGCDIPRVLTHHNIESVLMERRAEFESAWLAREFLRRESRKLRAYEAAASPRFDINIVVSRDDERTLTARVPGIRTSVVPNGVDTVYFEPQPEHGEAALVYTGGMNMFANRDAVMFFLREIWPLVRSRVPHTRFFAVGQDPPIELTAFAARDPRVSVTGYVNDIRPFVRESSVYVVPLRVGGGTRLKVLDAMAMGKALVSTSIGCEGIDVIPGRDLVVADSPASFAEATVSLLGDATRRQELGRNARRLVEKCYAWSVIGHRLVETYLEATATKRARA
jgi:sugar transferase (PEP-CTERM/EpsH1 system associated)